MKSLDEILDLLRLQKPYLQAQFNVSNIAVFGSQARQDATAESDVDILVDFEGRIGLGFVDLAEFLEKLLDSKVDLVSRRALRPEILRLIADDIRNA